MIARVLAFLLMALPALAATYYVRMDGDNANAGTANTSGGAWLTVQKAATTMVAGDTTYVQSGTYNEDVISGASGSIGSPIAFVAEGSVTINSIWIINAYNSLIGFTVDGVGLGAGRLIEINANGDNAIIRSNRISSASADQFLTWVDDGATNVLFDGNFYGETLYHGIILLGSNHLLTNNTFTATNGGDAIRLLGSNSRIVRNTFTNWSNLTTNENHTDLIQSYSNGGEIATNNIVESNYAINCVGAQPGNFSDDGLAGRISNWTFRNNVYANCNYAMNLYVPNFKFYNNTFYRCATNTGNILSFGSSLTAGRADNTVVQNNIFVECGANTASTTQGGYGWDVGLTNNVADYNLIVGTGAGTTKDAGYFIDVHGVNGSDPIFVDTSNDYSLQSGSPAIGAGTDLSATFTDDITGATRSAPWDIGAYEYDGSTPVVPTNGNATAVTVTVTNLRVQ